MYVILKAVVRLSHPAPLDLVLRKRLCLRIVAATAKQQQPLRPTSIKEKIRKRLSGVGSSRSQGRPLHVVSIIYQLVSNVPPASAELEDRKSLAVMAALGGGGPESATMASDANIMADNNLASGGGETFIERYSRGISAVDTVLFLDRLRQSVAVKEALKVAGKQGLLAATMRKTVSVPNFSSIALTGSRSMDNLALSALPSSRPSSSSSSTRLRTSMSVNDFDQSATESALLGPPPLRSGGASGRRARRGLATVPEGGGDHGSDSALIADSLPPRPTFLNLGPALSARQEENEAGIAKITVFRRHFV